MRLKVRGRTLGVSRTGRSDLHGRGPTLVLLHAFPLDSRMWELVATELHLDAELVAVDFPGLGQSALRTATIGDAADDVAAVLDELAVESAVLCGVSMGGYVALSFAAQHAQRLAGLLLADTRATADTAGQREARDRAIARVATEGSTGYVAELVPMLCAAASVPARDLALAIAGLQDPMGIAGALAALRDRPDRSGLLPSLAVPCAVVVGSEDALTPPAEARRLAEAIPGAALVEIAGAGHLSPLEAPAAFARAARDLLARVKSLR